jgi:D-xylose transport system substrate-binding protein
MGLKNRKNRTLRTVGAGVLLASATLATTLTGTVAAQASTANASVTIALLLPQTVGSPRYETQDKPDFTADVKKLDPNAKVIYNNAQDSASAQLQQAESAITNGAKVLVVDPVDSIAAASIVTAAKRAGVKVISYDRLIMNSKVDYYISFDNEKVGELQGEYIATHTKVGGTVVMLNGAKTDNNAVLFAAGAHKVLDPLFKSHKLKLGYESFTPNWDPKNGLLEAEQALTRLGNHVNGVLAANDNLAGAAVQALSAQKLKVPVTGQDATDAGLNRIYYHGTQSMTVYKAVPKEAQAAAELAVDLAIGAKPSASLINGHTNNTAENVPSVLLQPVVVTKSNVASTVIKDHFTTWAKIQNPGNN